MDVERNQSNQKLKRQSKYNIIEAIKDRIIRDIKNLFEQEKNHKKAVRICNSYGNNYIKNESNGDRNKTLSIKEYLYEIKSYLKDFIDILKKSDTWKI